MVMSNKSTPKNEDEARRRNYQFWSTQPVPSFTANTEVHITKINFVFIPYIYNKVSDVISSLKWSKINFHKFVLKFTDLL